MTDIEEEVVKLKEALAISEWHFKDAVQELIERSRGGGFYGFFSDEEDDD